MIFNIRINYIIYYVSVKFDTNKRLSIPLKNYSHYFILVYSEIYWFIHKAFFVYAIYKISFIPPLYR